MAENIMHRDVLELAVADGRFTLFLNAVKKAGLEEFFMTPGHFTLFAPVDAAFSRFFYLLTVTVPGDPFGWLKHVVLDHVVSGTVMILPFNPSGVNIFKTVTGKTLVLHKDKKIMINEARVLEADNMCRHGCLHVINRILTPDEELKEVPFY